MTDPKISFFKNGIQDTKPAGELLFSKYLELIQTCFWQSQVEPVRRGEVLKKDLSYVTISGTFSQRSNEAIEVKSNIMAIDLDDVSKDQVSLLPYDRFLAYHQSCSGNGIVVYVQVEDQRAAFEEAKGYFEDTLGLTIDNCGDLSRARFVSYDPGLVKGEGSYCWGSEIPTLEVEATEVTITDPEAEVEKLQMAVGWLIENDDKLLAFTEWNEGFELWAKFIGFPFGWLASEIPQFEQDICTLMQSVSSVLPGFDAESNIEKWNLTLTKDRSDGYTMGTFYAMYYELNPPGVAKINMGSKLIKKDEVSGGSPLEGKKFKDLSAIETVNLLIDGFGLERNALTGLPECSREEITRTKRNTMLVDIDYAIPQAKFDGLIDNEYLPIYHPVRSIAEEFRASGEAFEGTIDAYVSCIDTDDHFREYFKKWYVNLIATALSDQGVPNPIMLVLVGGQNLGKTEFFRRLLPRELRKKYYKELNRKIDLNDEHFMKDIARYLIIMDDEFDGRSPKDNEVIKSILTSDTATIRPLYTDDRLEVPRRASFCGTGNNPEIIDDPTGNRRILPFEVRGIDFERINAVDRSAMICEAYSMLQTGFDYRLTVDNIKHINNGQMEQFVRMRQEEEALEAFYSPASRDDKDAVAVTQTEVTRVVEKHYKIKVFRKDFAQLLRRLGYDIPKKTISVDGRKGKFFWVKQRKPSGYYEML